jgi:hypothetical protein
VLTSNGLAMWSFDQILQLLLSSEAVALNTATALMSFHHELQVYHQLISKYNFNQHLPLQKADT